jgi:hypothetical protein
VAVEAFATVYMLSRRMRYSEQAWKAMRRAGFQHSPRYRHHPVVDGDEPPWPRIGAFLQHLFPVNRLAILVLKTNRERLELVSTLGCSVSGVVERRRDVRRSPFSDAIERRTALQVDEIRPFFQPASDHCQYLVPLLFAGKAEGAIVVELSRAAAENCVALSDQLMSVGEEIAPWIARYQRISQHTVAKKAWWRRWRVTREQELFEHLQGHLYMMERRSHQTYQVVEQSSSGKAVFDLSGSVVTMNETMFRLLHPYGFASLDVTLLQLISSLCQRDLTACRALLRHVVVDGREERCILQNPNTRAHLVLMLRPLKAPQSVKQREDEMLAFETLGVHVELFESDMFSDVHELRDHIAEQALEVVDEILDEVHLLTQACRAGTMGDPWNKLDTSVELAQSTVQRCQSILEAGHSDDPRNCLPVAVAPLVVRSVAEAEAFVERSGISIHTSLPSNLPDVNPNPHRMYIALLWVLEELAHHAHGNSVIQVGAAIDADRVTLTCHCKDTELAIDSSDAVEIAVPSESPGQEHRLGEARQWLRLWGGELTIAAMPGVGSLVSLSLQTFDWNDRGQGNLVNSNCGFTSS